MDHAKRSDARQHDLGLGTVEGEAGAGRLFLTKKAQRHARHTKRIQGQMPTRYLHDDASSILVVDGDIEENLRVRHLLSCKVSERGRTQQTRRQWSAESECAPL